MCQLGRLLRLSISLWLVLTLAASALAIGPILSPQKCGMQWTAPTTNVDGTPLTDLRGYQLFIANSAGQFTTIFKELPAPSPAPAANVTVNWDCRTEAISEGQHYFQVKAVDLAGNASDLATPAAGETWIKADGAPFVFEAKPPAGATGLKAVP